MTDSEGTGATIERKVIYEQLCADFRSLNGFLWQTPIIIMTLTGGLWFAVASFDMSGMARSRLLLFAAIANVVMIAALFRLRFVMHKIQNQIRTHDGRPKIGPNFFIVSCFSLLLLIAAVGSVMASCRPDAYFMKGATPMQPRQGTG